MFSRIHYCSINFEKIHDYFKNFLIDELSISEIWIEWKKKPLHWFFYYYFLIKYLIFFFLFSI